MNDLPLVSFIIPCFNQAIFLDEAIPSIMLSYTGPKEIIVIDDCGTAPSEDRLLKGIKEKFSSVKVFHNDENLGLSATRNKGINLSTGQFIQFLDADDLLYPKKVNCQVNHFRFANCIDVSITDFQLADQSISNFLNVTPSIGQFDLTLNNFLYKWERGLSIPIHTALFKQHVFTNIQFEESLSAKEDWVFWCNLALSGFKMAYINVLGAVYRQHRASMTKSKLEEMGQMWKNAAKIISSNLEKDISDHFLNNAEDWYNEYYKQKLDISSPTKESDSSNPNKISNTEPVLSDLYRENKEGTLFSIVIPVFNHYEYLVKCIQSIFNQSFTGYEVICVDDNSSDVRIMDLLRTLEQKHTFIKVIHNNHNLGIANTTNIGIEASTGKYVVFVDCDDFIESDALCIIMKSLRKNPEIDYFFTDRIDVDENDHYIRKSIYGGYKNITPSNDIKSDLLDGMVASHLKIIRKSKIKEVGGLDATLEGVQDYDLALKLVSKSKFKYIKKALYNHRIHKSSVTSTKSIHQIRNSNIARRRTCDEWYPKDHNVSELFTKILKEEDLNNDLLDLFCSNENVQFFTPRDYALKKLKEQVSRGKFCIFDLQNEILGEWGFFLRDYNSYFDLILTNDKKITAYLLGCLWDYRILKFTDVQKQ